MVAAWLWLWLWLWMAVDGRAAERINKKRHLRAFFYSFFFSCQGWL
jgi:hypothetical protein